MDKEEVVKLSKLARIKISDEEALHLTNEFEAILKYVGEVKDATKAKDQEALRGDFGVRNVMRPDEETHDTGHYTDAALANAPSTSGIYVRVKKIL
jgi:aspartyl-tRNA(Asn)/glutamyl-tRNA(Gln) amidotransferase subunit C